MRGVYVALDLETTGLNPEEDDIIEIGAARFEDGVVVETYGTLVNPGRSVPDRVSAITGIRTEDLIGQPEFFQVRQALRNFVGDAVIVGHNVEFDLAFLARHAIGQSNLGDRYLRPRVDLAAHRAAL